jgi:hypothetical protein
VKKDATQALLVAAGVILAGLVLRFGGRLPLIADAREGLGGRAK